MTSALSLVSAAGNKLLFKVYNVCVCICLFPLRKIVFLFYKKNFLSFLEKEKNRKSS